MGLLTAFRLGGILKEPSTISENKILEAVSWNVEKPFGGMDIKDSAVGVYDEDVFADFTVFIDDYHVSSWAYGGSDYITIRVNITASTSEGFIALANITFWENYKESQVDFFEDTAWPKDYVSFKNLSITRHYDSLGTYGSGLKAFVELAGVNNPKSVSFGCFVNWVLRSPQNYTNNLRIIFELIHFNGTVYKRVIQPILLHVGPDDNNSFETADEIAVGETSRLYIGPNDVEDYYKVYLSEGCNISIQLFKWSPGAVADVDLELYSPDGKLAARSTHEFFHPIAYPINSSGYWFIRVRWREDFGSYTINIETHNQGGG